MNNSLCYEKDQFKILINFSTDEAFLLLEENLSFSISSLNPLLLNHDVIKYLYKKKLNELKNKITITYMCF